MLMFDEGPSAGFPGYGACAGKLESRYFSPVQVMNLRSDADASGSAEHSQPNKQENGFYYSRER